MEGFNVVQTKPELISTENIPDYPLIAALF